MGIIIATFLPESFSSFFECRHVLCNKVTASHQAVSRTFLTSDKWDGPTYAVNVNNNFVKHL